MSKDYDSLEPNGYMSASGFPENGYEPDDSDQTYYPTWEEAEARAERMQRQARSWNVLKQAGGDNQAQGTTRSKTCRSQNQ